MVDALFKLSLTVLGSAVEYRCQIQELSVWPRHLSASIDSLTDLTTITEYGWITKISWLISDPAARRGPKYLIGSLSDVANLSLTMNNNVSVAM